MFCTCPKHCVVRPGQHTKNRRLAYDIARRLAGEEEVFFPSLSLAGRVRTRSLGGVINPPPLTCPLGKTRQLKKSAKEVVVLQGSRINWNRLLAL